jgi:hypothetical protein
MKVAIIDYFDEVEVGPPKLEESDFRGMKMAVLSMVEKGKILEIDLIEKDILVRQGYASIGATGDDIMLAINGLEAEGLVKVGEAFPSKVDEEIIG